MSETYPPPAANPLGMPGRGTSRNRTLIIGLVAIGLLAALALGYWAVYSLVVPPTPPVPPGPTGSPPGWCFSVNSVPVSCDAPETLDVLDRLVSVQGVPPTADGRWPYFAGKPEYEDWASWVQGTVVNYVLGLSTSERNDDLFNRIDSGTLLTLTLSSGTEMVYRFQSYTEVDRTNEEQVFKQTQPALTLVLLGVQSDTKYVISCAWVATFRGDLLPPGEPPSIGVPATITETDMAATVMALSTTYLRDPTLGLPEGNAYFLIDFTVSFSGSGVLDTQAFNMLLVDADNQVYAPTGSAGPYGRYPQPVGLLENGEAITATLGYLVGELPGNTVHWEVQLRPTDVQSVTFQIPFSTEPPGQVARANAAITVSGAELSAEGNVIVSGSLANTTGEPLSVLAADLALTTGAGTSPLITADPPIPWYVNPNSQLSFRITFLRPPTGTAIFSLLGRQFIISNIP